MDNLNRGPQKGTAKTTLAYFISPFFIIYIIKLLVQWYKYRSLTKKANICHYVEKYVQHIKENIVQK